MPAGRAQTGFCLLLFVLFVFSRVSASSRPNCLSLPPRPGTSRTFLRKSGSSPKRSLARAPRSGFFFMAPRPRWYSSGFFACACKLELNAHHAFSICSSVGFPFEYSPKYLFHSSHFLIHCDGQSGTWFMGQGTTTSFSYSVQTRPSALSTSLVLFTSTNLERHQSTRSSAKRSPGDAQSKLKFPLPSVISSLRTKSNLLAHLILTPACLGRTIPGGRGEGATSPGAEEISIYFSPPGCDPSPSSTPTVFSSSFGLSIAILKNSAMPSFIDRFGGAAVPTIKEILQCAKGQFNLFVGVPSAQKLAEFFQAQYPPWKTTGHPTNPRMVFPFSWGLQFLTSSM